MTRDSDIKIKVVADFNFAMIPQWVILQGFTASAIAVYVVLAMYRNNETSTCFPSKSRIAEKAGVADNTVTKALRELVDGGAIKIEERYNGRMQTSNLYTLFMVGPHGIPKGFQPIEDTDRGSIDDPGGSMVGGVPGSTVGGVPGSTVGGVTKENNKTKRTRNNSSAIEIAGDRFEEFWAHYPKKKDKDDARRAWVKALRKAPADLLIERARLYAIARKGKDPQFTKHGATWLNKGAWMDEDDPEFTQRGNRRDEFDAMFYDAIEGYHGENALGFERKELGS